MQRSGEGASHLCSGPGGKEQWQRNTAQPRPKSGPRISGQEQERGEQNKQAPFPLSPSQSTFNTLGAPASTGVTAPWVPREQTPVGLQYHRVIL